MRPFQTQTSPGPQRGSSAASAYRKQHRAQMGCAAQALPQAEMRLSQAATVLSFAETVLSFAKMVLSRAEKVLSHAEKRLPLAPPLEQQR